MTPLEKARQAVVEAEEALIEAWPLGGPKLVKEFQESLGNEWNIPSRGIITNSWVDAADALAMAWRQLHDAEARELDAHRQRVLANNSKVSGQAASSAA